MKAKEEIEIWGKGHEVRDFLYITDLLNFIKLIIKKQKSQFKIYNCGSGKSTKILDLVKLIIDISNKKIKIKKNTLAPNIKFNLVLDSSKAINELGWKPMVNLNDGIRKTIFWWKKNYRD